MDPSMKGKNLKRATPLSIQDKFLVGYQGWFTCGGDGEPVGPGHHGWLHWFDSPIPYGGRPNIDIWPDVTSYSPSELFPAPGLKTNSGEQVFLFSSRHPKTVQRHFHWMAEHGVDGAFLQRFAGQCDSESGNEGIMRIRDEVGDRVREAAEKEGRVFAIMYDVSGVAPDRIQQILERDWIHLVRNKGILDSPNYIREKGKPVVALWGFGFDNRGHTPALVRAITTYIRNVTPGGAYIMAGTPAHWRTAESDADRNPEFLDVWLNDFDAISPWTVGRFTDEQGVDHFAETKMKGDVELINRRNAEGAQRKIDYIPVVLPGGSGFNLSQGKWGFNDIKRKGGRFLWKQIFNAKHLGVRIMYGAMWDEYDEGTAFMPVVESKRMLPVSDQFPFMALDEDGYDLPSDWYMRICGFAAEGLRSERRIHETFPVKELQDYWATRPRYEDIDPKSPESPDTTSASLKEGSGSGGNGQSYQEWLSAQKEANEEAPPPPYSLEAEEPSAGRPQSSPSGGGTLLPGGPSTSGTFNTAGPSHVSEMTPSVLTQPTELNPGSSQPPSVKIGSRPQQPYTTSPAPAASTSHSPQAFQAFQHSPAVSSLANDFGNIDIATQSQQPSSKNSSIPPPLHPAHPTASVKPYGKRPQTAHSSFPPRPGSIPRPQSQPRPGSQSGPYHPPPMANSGYSSVQGSVRPQSPPDIVPTLNQWGPASTPQQHSPPAGQSSYPGPLAGAQLTRPHTFSASSASSASLRPQGTVHPQQAHVSPAAGPGPASYRPPSSSQSYALSSSSPYPSVGAPVFPATGPSSSTPDGIPNPAAPLFPSGPSQYLYPSAGYPEQNGPSPFPVHTSYSPQGQNDPSPTLPESSVNPTAAPLASSFPSGSYRPGQPTPQDFPSTQGPTYLGQPYGGPASPTSQYPPVSYGNPHLPNNGSSQGEGFHFPQAQISSHPPAQGYQSYSDFPSHYGQQSSSSPYHAASPSGWFPGSSSNPVRPPMPPRPSTTTPYAYPNSLRPSHSSMSASTSTGSGALGFALSAVDKIAGRKTREQFESGVGSIAQSGNKLFNKLTK